MSKYPEFYADFKSDVTFKGKKHWEKNTIFKKIPPKKKPVFWV
jgi:hypothetical protein